MSNNIFFQLYIALLASIPTAIGVRLRYYAYRPLFKKSGGYFSIDRGVTILNFRNIELGKNINIMQNSYLYANDDGILVIGDNFSMNTNSQLGAAGGKIVIEENCSIGPNCVLRAADHAFSDPDKPFNQQGHRYGEIIIENDVWIASNCVITANTTIGKGSVIAAGSVVTKDVEPFSIMGGVPAKLIRKRT